jgi:signal peptidase I
MRRELIVALVCLGLGVGLILTIRAALPSYRLTTPSMEPTLPVGCLVYSRHTKRAWKRGDIVLHTIDDQIYAKRVIGAPGDRIRLDKRQLILNSSATPEPYTSPSRSGNDEYRDSFPKGDAPYARKELPGYQRMLASIRDGEVVVGNGDYFLLGDNRDNSVDSRFIGFVSADDIIGIAVGIFCPERLSLRAV